MGHKVYSVTSNWKNVAGIASIVTTLFHLSLYGCWRFFHSNIKLHYVTMPPLPEISPYDLKITTYQGDVSDGGFTCDHIMIHAASLGYERSNKLFLKRQQEWISHFPNDCFVFVSGDVGKLPTYLEAYEELVSANSWTEMKRRNRGKRVRYDAGVYFTMLAANGLLKRKTGSGIPWVLYTDVDVIMTNKSRGIGNLLERLDQGLSLGRTTEDRVCDNPAMFPCVPQQPKRRLTRDDIVLMIAADNDCHNVWMLNSGSQLWQPGLTHGWLMEADLTLFNDTTLKYSFDHFEQGKLALLMREAFDFDFNRLRALCAPFEADVWMPSVEQNEVLFLRELNYTRAIRHPVLGTVTHKWFPTGVPEGVPRYVAFVNPRWMNSFACAYNWGFGAARIEAQALHCGDFMGHFNGCGKDEHTWKSFRERLGNTPECQRDLPFLTMDDSDDAFDYTKWVASGVDRKTSYRPGEPKERIQRAY
eukprot:Gregarina_sp_Pseudo_9__304@NODE_1198_length_1785_cov_249_551546_g1124_i0_p1_GENE_NODE_1198_length_1785_cov_249_551546_g1124_i0NODE_1198_length_1785_cov_249_551546_g1124_i0_p1_ORF_typecomplete_len473_score101_02Glyco_transf_34/PF05637_12/0_058_NODE_1198_length_1785_cov_249_551546_g1124_i0461464